MDQPLELVFAQQTIRAVFAQMQVWRTIEVADREIADALFPVEAQAAFGVHAGERADRCGNAQILASILAFELREMQTLMALATLGGYVEADQIRIVDAQRIARLDVRSDFFKRMHGPAPRAQGREPRVESAQERERTLRFISPGSQ